MATEQILLLLPLFFIWVFALMVVPSFRGFKVPDWITGLLGPLAGVSFLAIRETLFDTLIACALFAVGIYAWYRQFTRRPDAPGSGDQAS